MPRPRRRARIEALDQLGGREAPRRGAPRPSDAASSSRTSAADWPSAARSASVTAPWRLASRAPSGPSTSGTWAWRGAASPSRAPSHSWRGVESSRSAPRTTSLDALVGVVDDHGEVVGEGAVVAAHDEVVDDALDAPGEAVVEGHARRVGATRSAGGRPRASRSARCAAVRRAAGARVGALGQRAVRRRRGLADLGARAAARVEEAVGVAGARAPPRRARRARTGARPAPSQSRPSARRSASWLGLDARAARGRVSRSSMRSRKRASWLRAKSQASSAVRRLPRCSVPVGEGAKRPSAVTTRLCRVASRGRWPTTTPPPPSRPRGRARPAGARGGSSRAWGARPRPSRARGVRARGQVMPGHDAQAARRAGGR